MKNQTIVSPKEGWRDHSIYLVTVQWTEESPEHRTFLYSGRLNSENLPGEGSTIINVAGSGARCRHPNIKDAYYLYCHDLLIPAESIGTNGALYPYEVESYGIIPGKWYSTSRDNGDPDFPLDEWLLVKGFKCLGDNIYPESKAWAIYDTKALSWLTCDGKELPSPDYWQQPDSHQLNEFLGSV